VTKRPDPNKTEPSHQVCLRVPTDLIVALDAFCRERGTRRTDVIIAATRAHLGARPPAEIPAGATK
jgi:hypothetical protein